MAYRAEVKLHKNSFLLSTTIIYQNSREVKKKDILKDLKDNISFLYHFFKTKSIPYSNKF